MQKRKRDNPHLTDHDRRLLKIVKDADGEWISRRQISDMLEKRRLNPYEAERLKRLSDLGLIEIDQREFHGPIGFEWLYRSVTKEATPVTEH